MTTPLLIAKNDKIELELLPQMANRHGLITGATGTGKTVTLQSLAESFSRIGVPVFMSDIKGDLSGISKIGGGNAKVQARVEQLKLEGFAASRLSGDVLGCGRQAGPSGARHRVRHGAAAAGAHAEPERHAAGRAHAGVQDRRRQRHAAARLQGSARDGAACRRQRQGLHHRIRQHFHRQHRRHPARPAGTG